MKEFLQIIKKRVHDTCGKISLELNQQTQEINKAISELTIRKAILVYKKEILIGEIKIASNEAASHAELINPTTDLMSELEEAKSSDQSNFPIETDKPLMNLEAINPEIDLPAEPKISISTGEDDTEDQSNSPIETDNSLTNLEEINSEVDLPAEPEISISTGENDTDDQSNFPIETYNPLMNSEAINPEIDLPAKLEISTSPSDGNHLIAFNEILQRSIGNYIKHIVSGIEQIYLYVKQHLTRTKQRQAPEENSGFEHQSGFVGFAKVWGDIHTVHRLTSGNQGDLESVSLHNEYFTRTLTLSREHCFPPIIYVLDTKHYLKALFDEIRHIESCIKYQKANWKRLQAKDVMEESYLELILLIDEILESYNPDLQKSPESVSTIELPNHILVRDVNENDHVVAIEQLSHKEEGLFLNDMKVVFAGYRKHDINVILPVPTLEVMNFEILQLIREELMQNQYKQSFEHWRACELRIQELGHRYESGLLGQLYKWLT